ncbi:uncharacterized protein LOC115963716 [Quercus lobata]|uniref:UBA domain-containing protein n=1 Tax=Quercus lobata TaxID=97700 RepID=A0A7N2MMT5_QUELO|nr:uncharacterized protein LOC115963716 [Quercus lobata]
MGNCCDSDEEGPPESRSVKGDPGSPRQRLRDEQLKQRSEWEEFVDWLRRWWQGDNESCDIERCDNEHDDNEQSDGDHIYEQKVQILVEMGFAEDDVRRALNENGCNELLALLMLCV